MSTDSGIGNLIYAIVLENKFLQDIIAESATGCGAQYYCHLNAFAMGVALGVDGIIMPHAKRRRKYTALATVWEETRADTLWDVTAIRRYAAGAQKP